MNYKKALYIDSVNLQYELNDFNLIHIENLLYNQAWAYYEIDREQNNQKIQRKFWAAQRFAEFNRKEELINLLKMRENKYLKENHRDRNGGSLSVPGGSDGRSFS